MTNALLAVFWAATSGWIPGMGAPPFALDNASTWTAITTHDGSGQAIHPSVVTSGTTYYMAMSPYPDGDNSKELPNIMQSADGDTWTTAAANPLAQDPVGSDYCLDPEIVLADGVLWLYYGMTSGTLTEVATLATTSSNAADWSATTTLFELAPYPQDEVSPSVIYTGGTFHYWAQQENVASNLVHRTSTDGKTWSTSAACTLSPAPIDLGQTGDLPHGMPWHFDVIESDGGFLMIWCTRSDTTNGNGLFMATSANGTAWTFYPTPLMTTSASGWDDAQLYRPTMLLESGVLKVWYSAQGSNSEWYTGYTEAPYRPVQQAASPAGGGTRLWR